MRPTSLTALIILAAAALPWAIGVGCGSTDSSSGAECHAGDRVACTCADGKKGLAACEGGTFAACACASTTGSGGGAGTGGGASAGGTGGTGVGGGDAGEHEGGPSTSDAGFGEYMGPCDTTADCPEGDICFDFTTKGKFCTKQCMTNADCPPPSPKCNPKMVCAVPD